MTSPRDRQAKSRKARREAGLVQFTRWIPADKLDAMSAAHEAICKTPNETDEARYSARLIAATMKDSGRLP